MKIGFIGIGVMGRSMAKHLMKAGHQVSVYNRTKAKAAEVIAAGALWRETVADCCMGEDVIITMVGYPKDVEEVYFGEAGVIAAAKPGAYLIDMTTTSPELSKRIYAAAQEKGLHALDAPVSGGDTGAKLGSLSIMVGGDVSAFEVCLPLFEILGENIIYQGGPGAGQHTKMANQIAIAGAISGVVEALAYGEHMGLDPKKMLASISQGAAGSFQMSQLAPKMVEGDFAPGFYLKHFIKDMQIADAESQAVGLSLSVLEDALAKYQELAAKGLGDLGTQALIKYYEKD